MTEIVQSNELRPVTSERLVKIAAIALALLGIVATITWSFGLIPGLNSPSRTNSIMTIAPYRYNGTWVFDDLSAGLIKEPFVAGVPEMIDILVEDIPAADSGFRMLFSANPFPGYQKKLTWLREESSGNYYSLGDPPIEGWICPAMFKYFEAAPKELFIKAEPLD